MDAMTYALCSPTTNEADEDGEPLLLTVPGEIITGNGELYRVIPESGRYAPVNDASDILPEGTIDAGLEVIDALLNSTLAG